jgi:hypothetical protein
MGPALSVCPAGYSRTRSANCSTVSPSWRMPFMNVPYVASTLSLSSSSEAVRETRWAAWCPRSSLPRSYAAS